jgi:hypothetical protein
MSGRPPLTYCKSGVFQKWGLVAQKSWGLWCSEEEKILLFSKDMMFEKSFARLDVLMLVDGEIGWCGVAVQTRTFIPRPCEWYLSFESCATQFPLCRVTKWDTNSGGGSGLTGAILGDIKGEPRFVNRDKPYKSKCSWVIFDPISPEVIPFSNVIPLLIQYKVDSGKTRGRVLLWYPRSLQYKASYKNWDFRNQYEAFNTWFSVKQSLWSRSFRSRQEQKDIIIWPCLFQQSPTKTATKLLTSWTAIYS